MTVLGVVADTHIPDRARRLDPRVGEIFRAAGVDLILHAGDISTGAVLQELGQIAPVHAVRGNRDWVALRHLPFSWRLSVAGIKLALNHGHGRWWRYLIHRLDYIARGYRLGLFEPYLLAEFPDARVIVFGHTHRPHNRWVDRCLLFNPGSPHCPEGKIKTPSVGLLRISAGGEVRGEIVSLESGSILKVE